MTDKIAEIRARHEAGARGMLPLPALAEALDDRATLLAEVERQNRHIDLLQEKMNAEKSCACSYDNPDDVCVKHSPQLVAARAEIERLRAEMLDLAEWCETEEPLSHKKLAYRLRAALEGKP